MFVQDTPINFDVRESNSRVVGGGDVQRREQREGECTLPLARDVRVAPRSRDSDVFARPLKEKDLTWKGRTSATVATTPHRILIGSLAKLNGSPAGAPTAPNETRRPGRPLPRGLGVMQAPVHGWKAAATCSWAMFGRELRTSDPSRRPCGGCCAAIAAAAPQERSY